MRLLLCLLCGAALAFSQATPARVTGCLVDSTGGVAADTPVELEISGEWRKVARTDPKGCFEFRRTPGGAYRLRFGGSAAVEPVVSAETASRTDDFGTITLRLRTSRENAIGPVPAAVSAPGVAPAWEPSRIVMPLDYPLTGLLARIDGDVELLCTLSEGGDVLSATALAGERLLADSAIRNVKKWRFRPVSTARGNTVHVSYRFKIASVIRGGTTVTYESPNTVRITNEAPVLD